MRHSAATSGVTLQEKGGTRKVLRRGGLGQNADSRGNAGKAPPRFYRDSGSDASASPRVAILRAELVRRSTAEDFLTAIKLRDKGKRGIGPARYIEVERVVEGCVPEGRGFW